MSDSQKAATKPQQGSEDSSAFAIALFRVLFGLLLLRFCWDLYNGDWIALQPGSALFIPTYRHLGWISMEPELLRSLVLVLCISTLGITIGFCYRLNCLLSLVLYSIVYLQDASWSTPSKYLVGVVLVALSLTNAHAEASLDSFFLHRFWQVTISVSSLDLWAFKVLLSIPPLMAGFSKYMSADWMERGEPLGTWLFFGSLSNPRVAMFSALAGPPYNFPPAALSDLALILSHTFVYVEILGTVGMWHRWTFWPAFFARSLLLFFQASIAQGLYPYILISSSILFMSPGISKRILQLCGCVSKTDHVQVSSLDSQPGLLRKSFGALRALLLILLLSQQILTPMLPYTTSTDPLWSKDQDDFSWRMMLQASETFVSWEAHVKAAHGSNLSMKQSIRLTHYMDRMASWERTGPDQWHSTLNSPSLLLQWTDTIIYNLLLPTELNANSLSISSFRSINGRPFQRWLKKDRLPSLRNMTSPWGDDLLVKPIAQFATSQFESLEWMYLQQTFIDEWLERGFESAIFALAPGDRPTFEFLPFAEQLFLIPLAGDMLVTSSASQDAILPVPGEQIALEFGVTYSVVSVKPRPIAWAFTWSWPRNMTLNAALQM